MKARIAVLASGSGSNLQAILDHTDRLGAGRSGDVVLVLSNTSDAGALERAERHGIAAAVLHDHADGAAMLRTLEQHGVDLVVLAGYLKLVPPAVVQRHAGRMLNVHPALLPAFGGEGMYGRRVHAAVLASGARVTGVTVHFVSEEYDRGPIVAQWPVPVRDGDTPASLAERVLRTEHVLYPRVVEAVAAGRLRLGPGGRICGSGVEDPLAALLAPHERPGFFAFETDAARAAASVERLLGG